MKVYKKHIIMKTIKFWAGAVLALLVCSTPLKSATILTGESVRVSAPVDGNIYAGAGQITIDAVVNGDVNAGTGELRVNDTIRGNLVVGGGRLYLNGVVGEDLRCAGGELTLRGQVLGDMLVGGGEIEIGPDAVIYGDLVIGGGRVRIAGRVLGSLIVAGGEIEFSGTAEKDAEIRGGTVRLDGVFRGPCTVAAETLQLGGRSEFYQDVRYWQKTGEVDFGSHLRDNARATFDTSLQQDMDKYKTGWFVRTFSMFFLWRLLAGVLIIAVLVWLFDAFFQRSGRDLPAQWANRFGAGLIYLLGAPMAVIALFITVIGIPLGLFALFFYMSSLGFAYTLTATVGAYALEQYRRLSWSKGQRILVAIGLLIALKIITWIPFFGFLLAFVAVGTAFGSIIRAIWPRPAVTP